MVATGPPINCGPDAATEHIRKAPHFYPDNMLLWPSTLETPFDALDGRIASEVPVPDYFAMISLRSAWLGIVLLVTATFDVAAEPRQVFLLHSFGRNFEPFISMTASFREELIKRSPEKVELQEASIEILKPDDTAGEAAFVKYLSTQFSGRRPDLVVTFGAPAANFLLRHRADLFQGTPLLITGIEQRRLQAAELAPNEVVAGFLLDITSYLENIIRVLPNTTNIAVVSGSAPLDKFWLSEMHREFRPFLDRVRFTWLSDLPFEDVLSRAAVLPPRSAIFFATLIADAKGIPYDQQRALDRLHAVANSPIFGVADYHFPHGIVGGPMFSTLELGRRATGIALRMLNGEPPSTLRVQPLGVDVRMYDGRELKRWNISESLLPDGSEVRFRPPAMWDEYRTQIAVGIAVLLLQAAMITWLLIESYRRRQAEIRSRRHLLEVIHLNRTAGAGVMSAALAHEINSLWVRS